MFWVRSGLPAISTISDWLSAGPAAVPDSREGLEAAREAMVEALGEAGCRRRAALALRIATAKDAQGLWALRPELMTAACQLYGEVDARARLAAATASFAGLVPSQLTRPGPGRRIAA